jgi:hypothetical protein
MLIKPVSQKVASKIISYVMIVAAGLLLAKIFDPKD